MANAELNGRDLFKVIPNKEMYLYEYLVNGYYMKAIDEKLNAKGIWCSVTHRYCGFGGSEECEDGIRNRGRYEHGFQGFSVTVEDFRAFLQDPRHCNGVPTAAVPTNSINKKSQIFEDFLLERVQQKKAVQEQAKQEKIRQEQARQEQARQEQAKQEKARQEQARQEQAKQEQARKQQQNATNTPNYSPSVEKPESNRGDLWIKLALGATAVGVIALLQSFF